MYRGSSLRCANKVAAQRTLKMRCKSKSFAPRDLKLAEQDLIAAVSHYFVIVIDPLIFPCFDEALANLQILTAVWIIMFVNWTKR